MFFFNKKKIHIDCFTDRLEVFTHAKPYRALEQPPQWFKDNSIAERSPFDPASQPTIRGCPAVVHHLSRSIVIPLWSDFSVRIESGEDGANYLWKYSDGVSLADVHTSDQRFNIKPGYINFKLISPWYFKGDTTVMYSEPLYYDAYPEGVCTVNGLYDMREAPQTNMHLFCRVPPLGMSTEYHLKLSDPILSLTPATEKAFTLKCHHVTTEELSKIHKSKFYSASFKSSYYKLKKIRDASSR